MGRRVRCYTREELRTRRDRRRGLAANAGFLVLVLVILGLLVGLTGPEATAPGEQVPRDVANRYAADEYLRILGKTGDPGDARRGADKVYQEVLETWQD